MTWTRLTLMGVLCLVPLFLAAQDPAHEEGKEAEDAMVTQAREVAGLWLAGIDSGAFGESWSQAATLFKEALTNDYWIEQLNTVRKPLGAVKSRTFKSGTYTRSLPSAPEGEYVVIQYETVFESYPQATETVTPMKDPDGVWRVAGYFIK